MRIGDRFELTNVPDHYVIEVVALSGENNHKLVVNTMNRNNYPVGKIGTWGRMNTSISWSYIGNFNKYINFNILYNKLRS